ncbi:PopZ family protein [Methylopila henanensis]|uniref:PopZ family protein n=2 Tax=Methylopila henanensis TaxID=873516 RepID=A0ABW4K4P2_9HYPH
MAAEPAAAAEPEPEPAPRFAPRAQPREPEPAAAFADRLVSPSTDETVGAAFGSLANTILATNGRTIDDLVKEMLRPMLRAWLDDNLPPLVERLVRQEIERVARGR